MKTNILVAFKNILENPLATVNPAKISSNRINNAGDALEGFLKDIYAGTLGIENDEQKDKIYSEKFSWLGNSSHPPDFIITRGDAVEVKKINHLTAGVPLNSSYPKNKLHANDPRVASGAKQAEEWEEKDIVYAIGSMPGNELRRLWLIYGDCYAASREVYEKIVAPISKASRAVYSELGFDLEIKTNEIAKFNKVDPLGITDLRVRGMWHIKNPSNIFKSYVKHTDKRQYYILMREEKYQSFLEEDKKALEELSVSGYNNSIIEIRNPDNPAELLKARFIKYEI